MACFQHLRAGITLLTTVQTRTLRFVLFWCLPTFVLLVTTIAEVTIPFYAHLPFHRQRILDEIWMTVAAFLPITTIVAAVKAISLRFRVADEQSIWQPFVGWGAVLAAAVLNVLFYLVIADTLR